MQEASSAPHGLLGRACLGPKRPYWLKLHQPGTGSKQTGAGRTSAAKYLLKPGSSGAVLPCSIAAEVLPGWIKTEEKALLSLPQFTHWAPAPVCCDALCARGVSKLVNRPRSHTSSSSLLFFYGLKIKGWTMLVYSWDRILGHEQANHT